jgi:hypothetical protein
MSPCGPRSMASPAPACSCAAYTSTPPPELERQRPPVNSVSVDRAHRALRMGPLIVHADNTTLVDIGDEVRLALPFDRAWCIKTHG